MKALRIILGVLAIIPIGLLAYIPSIPSNVYMEDSLATLAYLACGVPILIFNLWIWGAPYTMEDFLGTKDKPKTE